MNQFLYAQLDQDDVCIGISQLSGEVTKPNMIPLAEAEYSMDLIGRAYKDGSWGERPEDLTEALFGGVQ